ncbi:hypothetical protein DOY81_003371 [Sarcophaga bullata]|nr:hypothetical protein DOY81_003371 [Sarcophaga bullata]
MNATTTTTTTNTSYLSSSCSNGRGTTKYADHHGHSLTKNATILYPVSNKTTHRRYSSAAIVDIEMSTMSLLGTPTTMAASTMNNFKISKSNSLAADASYHCSYDYQQQQQQQLQQQQYLQQWQHMQHKEKYMKNYIASHAHAPCALPESLRIIETVIAEDAETNAANTPESQTETTTTTTTNSSLQLIQQMQQQSSANIMSTTAAATSSNSSSLSIYNTALPQSFSFSPSSTMTTTNTSFMTASASVPTSVSAASSNTSCSNKYTRKRERVCHSNSNNTLSKLANCRAFSK